MRKESDFFMRIINQFAGAIGRAISLALGGHLHDSEIVIEQATTELLKLTPTGVTALSDEDLLATLQLNSQIAWQAKAIVLASLLHQDAAIKLARGEEGASFARRLKALGLMLSVSAGEWELPDYAPTVDELVETVAEFQLPASTNARLFAFYQQQGQYDLAENVLFDWLESELEDDGAGIDPVAAGIDFYRALQGKDDQTLMGGGLPREEVDAGLSELLEMLETP